MLPKLIKLVYIYFTFVIFYTHSKKYLMKREKNCFPIADKYNISKKIFYHCECNTMYLIIL